MKLTRAASIVALILTTSCWGKGPTRTPSQKADDSAAAVKALQGSQFADAAQQATLALHLDPHNARAAGVRAIATYEQGGDALYKDLEMLARGADIAKVLDHEEGRRMWQAFADQLAQVDSDLAIAAEDPSFTLELCIACWEHDWNHNGRVDDRDRKLFEIEYDPHCDKQAARAPKMALDEGNPDYVDPPPQVECSDEIPEGDVRRRPTFKFDVGDVDWARAMIAFQRAVVEIILAYRWEELDKLFQAQLKNPKIVLHLADAKRAEHARELIVAGLGFSARSRDEYLAETDDDHEWLPNPSQKHHPIPLPMDAAIYDTWKNVIGDLQRMLASEEGLSLRGAARLVDKELAIFVPDAYVDLGAMLREPQDITLDFGLDLDSKNPMAVRPAVEAMLKNILGKGYRPAMRPSPILERIARMKSEIDHDDETVERKLHYLFWIN
jgi:hypothetical protein